MVECAITYCDDPAVKAVQNGGVRIHVCPNHGGIYEPIPYARGETAPDGSGSVLPDETPVPQTIGRDGRSGGET